MNKTFIFIGPSGSGKGTQVARLGTYLKEKDENKKIFFVPTGERFREFIKGEKHANILSRTIYKKGDRQPDFLAIYAWADLLINKTDGSEHLIFDGTPRSLNEAVTLDSALHFFGKTEVYVIALKTSREWSTERLLGRRRSDDNLAGIEKRLNWYEKDVVPVIEYYKKHPRHTFIEINGEQTRDEVEEELKKKLKTAQES